MLSPCLPEEFLASSWGRSYRHVEGWSGKFAHLLPWEHLNEILSRHRLDFPRLRLIRDGERIQTASYIRHASGGQRNKPPIPRLQHAALTGHLRQGATLVLDAVDELSEPLEQLATGLELFFHERVQINAYAGWHTTRGFDLHWDEHDVFILQVAGRKRWQVYGMTRPYPLAQDSAKGSKPETEPLWDAVLADGDLLYIPRGWWHVAMPVNEASLHLTVGVHNRTGVDLMRWLTERLRDVETFRQDLPRFASAAARAAHTERLRQALCEMWDEDVLERYFEEYDAMAAPRARFSLPWSATAETLPPSDDALVRLVAPRPLDFKMEDGAVTFSALKQRWRFALPALHVLRPLNERHVCSIRELCEESKNHVDEETVRRLLCELVSLGLLAVVAE